MKSVIRSRRIWVFGAITLIAALVGLYVISRLSDYYVSNSQMNRVAIGMSRVEVESVLGTTHNQIPTKSETQTILTWETFDGHFWVVFNENGRVQKTRHDQEGFFDLWLNRLFNRVQY